MEPLPVRYTFVWACILIISTSVSGQFSGSNLMEAQFGKLPTETADPFPSIYNRTILKYRVGKFRLAGTLEQYHTGTDGRSYVDPSQLSVQYRTKGWDIKVGNMYETLGRGFLLRSFEINGAVIEDFGFRSRTYFHRDILGASIKYKSKKLTIHAMNGEVLNNLLPPTFDLAERRTDSFSSLATKYKYYKKHRVELIYMNYRNEQSGNNNLVSASLEGPLPGNMEYYLTYATSVDRSDQYSIYGNIGGFVGDLSYTLEYKNYQNFVLGAGINEPPPGIKQQTYRVLNRSTHVSNPLSEVGYQIELIYGLDNGSLLTFNHAYSRNSFSTLAFDFTQYFLEWSSTLSKNIDYKIFVDLSQDDIKNERNRWSTGIYTDIKINKNIRLLPEIEYQRFERGEKANNQFYSLGINYKSKLNVNLQIETTTDPFLQENDDTRTIYPGINVKYQINPKNSILAFGGRRRGGPACSAGVCYEILDFEGFELRWNTRF